MSKKTQGNILLLITALIWGCAFVAQKQGMNEIGPLAFNGIRTILGGFALLPIALFMDKKEAADNHAKPSKDDRKTLIIGGLICGFFLFFAGNAQQVGLAYTSVGHAGFITALYVVLVPICGLFVGKRVRPLLWVCVAASAAGLYLLCISSEGFGSIGKGDLLMLACAFGFTLHILFIDYFSPKVNGVKLSCFQFFIAGLLSVAVMVPVDSFLGFDPPTLSSLLKAAVPLLYSGVLSCGAGYTLQIYAQKNTGPTIASMILCLESVFALLAGMVILGEMLSPREFLGCGIMFAAIIISQLPEKKQL